MQPGQEVAQNVMSAGLPFKFDNDNFFPSMSCKVMFGACCAPDGAGQKYAMLLRIRMANREKRK